MPGTPRIQPSASSLQPGHLPFLWYLVASVPTENQPLAFYLRSASKHLSHQLFQSSKKLTGRAHQSAVRRLCLLCGVGAASITLKFVPHLIGGFQGFRHQLISSGPNISQESWVLDPEVSKVRSQVPAGHTASALSLPTRAPLHFGAGGPAGGQV